MTAEQDTMLFIFWTFLEAVFVYLWVTTLIKWWMYQDATATIYATLYLLLGLICAINSVIRSGFFNFDAPTLIAVQRAFWFCTAATCLFLARITDNQRARNKKRAKQIQDVITQHYEQEVLDTQ